MKNIKMKLNIKAMRSVIMKRISKDIWAVFKLLYQNKGRFSINALLLQLIMIFISSTYLILLFNMMLKVAGQSQLTD